MPGSDRSSVAVSDPPSPSVARLAELVEQLCACSPAVARDAVRRVAGSASPASADEALALVARAMIQVRQPTATRHH